MLGRFRKSTDAGFTLMELMVAVAIAAVLAVIAIPNFGIFMANVRLKNSADDLYFSLQRTRMEAIRSGGRWMVNFSTTSYQIINCVDNDCGTTPNTTLKEVPYSNYSGLTFSDTFSDHKLEFTSEGMVRNPDNSDPVGRVTITNSKGKSKTIEIKETGIIHFL